MLIGNTGNPQAEFVQHFLSAIRAASQHGTETPPEINIIKNLLAEIQKSIGKYDRLDIRVDFDSVNCGGHAVPNSAEAMDLKDLLQKRRIASINFPKRPPTGELWSLLTTLGGPPELLTAHGGPGYALMAAGINAMTME